MNEHLATALFLAGGMQYSILIASALVPNELRWTEILAPLPKLVRQLFWVYGGYVVLSITALATICVVNSVELSSGSWLARSVCAYGAAFWGIRLTLQTVLDVKPFLRTWWLAAGYHLLTVLFIVVTLLYLWGAVHPA